MKKIFNIIILICGFVLMIHIALKVATEYPARQWLAANKHFAENLAHMENEDPTRADTRYSALVLSFNQDNIPTVFGPKKMPLFYDFEGKGQAVRTGWARSEARVLVIDQGNGPKLMSYDGSGSGGFDFLAAQDANGDGLIDGRDPVWTELKLWLDRNFNGRMDRGELKPLSDMNVTALNLDRRLENKYVAAGNFLREAGTFIYSNGRVGRLDEVFLRQHSDSVRFAQPIEVSPEIAAALPDIPGSGLVRGLREAAMLDPAIISLTGSLLKAETDAQRWKRLDDLMSVWAATAGQAATIDERGGGRYIITDDGLSGDDGPELARRLRVLDAWIGHYVILLPHELNPVQMLYDGVVLYDAKTRELAIDYQSLKVAINRVYDSVSAQWFKKFFPGSEAGRPGLEAVPTMATDNPEAVR